MVIICLTVLSFTMFLVEFDVLKIYCTLEYDTETQKRTHTNRRHEYPKVVSCQSSYLSSILTVS